MVRGKILGGDVLLLGTRSKTRTSPAACFFSAFRKMAENRVYFYGL